MRRSGWIIVAIIACAALAYIGIWFYVGFDIAANPTDLVLTIVWWVLVLIVCVAVAIAEKRRQEAVRTTFISPDYLYNIESGLTEIDVDTPYVVALQKVLTDLEYGMRKKDIKSDVRTRFICVVRSSRFAREGEVWEGEVVKFASPTDLLDFQDKAQLNSILQKVMG